MNSKRIATATTADNATQINIWQETSYTGKTIYIVDFVHLLRRASDRRSMTWATKFTEKAAREAANACWARWNGNRGMIAA
ncbi:hypothetical protein EG850_11070 [Gulosibacter macacae]|uniref:Uncharacterized protein n=1 Tax=Gulosibacter macacae TaxID=2488791 RepID=A0A3P3VWT9_9MICO|nr:hypothetical protein [Gulosibacter macacae]RRJ85919.1 hypothetical protein EG850_11070 [Gulosibacter macacae]